MNKKILEEIENALKLLNAEEIGMDGLEFIQQKMVELYHQETYLGKIREDINFYLRGRLNINHLKDLDEAVFSIGCLISKLSRSILLKESYEEDAQEDSDLFYDDYLNQVQGEVVGLLEKVWGINFTDTNSEVIQLAGNNPQDGDVEVVHQIK